MHIAERYHDISCGHRVVGHEGKCRFLHGHNYRIHFSCIAASRQLDLVGRVVDFGVIKERLCMWLENHWDHKFLIWEKDPLRPQFEGETDLQHSTGLFAYAEMRRELGIVTVPFNPTAENMAEYLVNVIGPQQLQGTGIILLEVRIEETRKCSASYRGHIND
jgi:6-pyruvoyltetrahydropterin/6-carboxytetrahydropterin synthase